MDEEEDLALGIDLGTTFSCVAVFRNNKVEIIPNEIGEYTTPSLVSFTDNGILVGEETLNQLITNPKNTIYSIKRLIGKTYKDKEIQEDIKSNFWAYDIVEDKSTRPKIKIKTQKKEKYFFPEEISSFILEKLYKSAMNYLGKPIKNTVITVPAYFNDFQRKATKIAGEQAGLKVLQIINEPTAASLAYGLLQKLNGTNNKNENDISDENIINISNENNIINENNINNENNENNINNSIENNNNNEEKLIIVFDLGGGTLDVTLLGIEDQDFQVLATSGNTHLGGNDFDKRIIDHCLKEFSSKLNFDINKIKKNEIAMNRLKIASEKAKINLSFEKTTSIYINEFYNNELLNVNLTREKFEEICNDLFEQIMAPLFNVLEDAGKDINKLHEIVLVGRSIRIPRIKESIRNIFSCVNINDSINPELTVAYGAAIQAAMLMNGNNEILNEIYLFDITPFSLGIDIRNPKENLNNKNKGHIMSIIIPKGTRIPVENTKNYTNVADNQTTIVIKVFEGENKYAKDNNFLGLFQLVDLPRKPKGKLKINVNFKIDENGILTVTAFEATQNKKSYIEIINDKKFDKNEIMQGKENDVIFENRKSIINYKDSMKKNYRHFIESKNIEDKYNYLYNYADNIFKLINGFEKSGNDCLGNKYFVYIKMLFKAYRILIQLNTQKDKDLIIKYSQLLLSILANFENIDYNHYVDLLRLFVIELTPKDKDEVFEGQKKDPDLINYILFNLVIFVMGLLEKKAKTILCNKKLKFSRYSSKYIFENCIQISNLFINSELDSSKYSKLREKHNEIIKNCKDEMKKINANSLVEIEKSKESGKLFDNSKKMKREELLILLDNYRESLKILEDINDFESKAIILANIVKINYKYLNNENFGKLKKWAQESIDFAKQSENKNAKNSSWYIEINEIVEELTKKNEEKEKKEDNIIKEENKDELDELENYQCNTADDVIEFIENILEKYKLPKNPLKYKTVKESLENGALDLINVLSKQYSTKKLKNINTKEMKIKYKIYNIISTKLNSIFLKFKANEIKFSK